MAVTSLPTGVSNGELVRWAFGVLDTHDVTTLKPFWTDAVEHFPDRTCRGSDEVAAWFEDMFAAFPDMRVEVVALVEQGDDVFVQWRAEGTHQATIFGIAATGKRVAVDGMDHFVIRDGKVVSNHVVYDQLDFARQLGLMPPDASPADRALKAAFNAATKVAQQIQARRNTS